MYFHTMYPGLEHDSLTLSSAYLSALIAAADNPRPIISSRVCETILLISIDSARSLIYIFIAILFPSLYEPTRRGRLHRGRIVTPRGSARIMIPGDDLRRKAVKYFVASLIFNYFYFTLRAAYVSDDQAKLVHFKWRITFLLFSGLFSLCIDVFLKLASY